MGTWLDMVGSVIFGAALVLLVARLGADVAVRSAEGNLVYSAQVSAAVLTEMMERDLRRMGLSATGTALVLADSTDLRFLADLNADGVPESVRYHVGPIGGATSTPHREDRVLYRTVGAGDPEPLPLGIVSFEVRTFDAAGLTAPTDLADVRQVEIAIGLESTVAWDGAHERTHIVLRIGPRNLGL